MIIFVSIGHNNARNIRNLFFRDKWASSGGYTEFNICSSIAGVCDFQYVRVGGKNKIVVVPVWLSLVDRIAWINARCQADDVCVELHMNAGGGRGVETFYFAWSNYAKAKANTYNNNLCSILGLRNRGVKPDTATRFWRLWFVRDTKPLALLLELWFIDNTYDRMRVIERGSHAVANALKVTFG